MADHGQESKGEDQGPVCTQHKALSGGRTGSEMFPTSASSCSESSWGFPLAEVIVSGVMGFALGDKKHVCVPEFRGKWNRDRQWEGGSSSAVSLIIIY